MDCSLALQYQTILWLSKRNCLFQLKTVEIYQKRNDDHTCTQMFWSAMPQIDSIQRFVCKRIRINNKGFIKGFMPNVYVCKCYMAFLKSLLINGYNDNIAKLSKWENL